MSTEIQYRPKGVCSRGMQVILADDGTIEAVSITGGCDGNLNGITALIQGMDAKEAIARMQGIHCGPKATSCPDQLAIALTLALEAQG